MSGSSFLDLFLSWFVIAIPLFVTVGATVIALKLPQERHYRKFVIAAIAVGLLFSIITFWQQNRALTQAAQDRDKAIKDTADRVAKQTTENVTQALAKQYGTTITEMAKQLAEQGKKVERIGQSDIVTGKKPVSVVVTNPTPATGAGEQPLEIHVSRLSATPDPQYGRNAAQFILTTNKVMNGGRVRVECTKGRINQGNAHIPGAGVIMSGGGGVQDDHTYVSDIGSPNWSPDFPLLITLYFDGDLGVCSFKALR